MENDLRLICRLCLNKTQVSVSLFEDGGAEILESLTALKIEKDDTYPIGACIKCWANLKLAYRIQQNFLEADRKLRSSTFLETKNSTVAALKVERFLPDASADNIEEIPQTSNSETVPESVNIKQENMEITETCIKEQPKADLEPPATMLAISISSGKCWICGCKITESKRMSQHIKVHFMQPQECDICDFTFDNLKSYQLHMAQVHDDYLERTYSCPKCPAVFKYKALHKIHIEKAHKVVALVKKMASSREKAGTKKIVDRRFKIAFNKASMAEAKNNIGKSDNPSTAEGSSEQINEASVNIENAENSKETTLIYKASGPKNVQCSQCQKKFHNNDQLERHISVVHTKRSCPICGTKIRPDNLKKHISLHTASQVVCHICGAVAKNHESLRGHLYRTHSNLSLPCPHCDRVFKKKYNQKLHILKEHTGEKNHTCEICGKAFFTKFNLNSHVRMTHLKLRPFICQYCQKAFSSKYALRTHERQHTNDAPYKCDICGEGFRQNVSCRAHKKSKHNVVEEMTTSCKVCGKAFMSDAAVKSHMRLHL